LFKNKYPPSLAPIAFSLWLFSPTTLATNHDCAQYFFIQQGNNPILLSAPHGADKDKRLDHLPMRTGFIHGEKIKSFVNRADAKTDRITLEVNKALMLNDIKPFVIVANIHRGQIDFNRPPAIAYEHPSAEPCYQFYHSTIRQFIDLIKRKWTHGFMVDIHGQSRFPYDIIRGTRHKETIKQLIARYNNDVTEADQGLYRLLRQQGYAIQPKLGEEEVHYYGGFTLDTYGSHNADGIDALQLEIGRDIRLNESKRMQFIAHLTNAITLFYRRYYP
jgi:hypothetical protein